MKILYLLLMIFILQPQQQQQGKKHFSVSARNIASHLSPRHYKQRHAALMEREAEFTASNRSEVVAFWNIYAGGNYFADINKEQRFVMESSGLMDQLDIVYYTTIGSNGSNYRMPGAKMKHLHFHGRRADEARTQQLLYRYCHLNPLSKVLYFHNKGSYNYHITNTNFRKALDCFVLNPRCIEQLEKGYDTCGWRISMVPHVHYSGNYWWATCRHINRLLPPLAPLRNETFLRVTSELNPHRKSDADFRFHDYPNLGLGRYFAETWVGSLPNFSAADCLSHEADRRYLGGYTVPWILINNRCPSWRSDFADMVLRYDVDTNSMIASAFNSSAEVPRLSYGMPCSASEVCYQPELFKGDDAVQREVRSFAHYITPMIQRSLLWYGQKPTLYMTWMQAILGDTLVPKAKGGDDMKTVSDLIDSVDVEKVATEIALRHASNSSGRPLQHYTIGSFGSEMRKYRRNSTVSRGADFLHRFKVSRKGDHTFTRSNASSIVAFWNIYAGGNYFADINKEQRFVMESSGLMDQLDIVYYTTIGSNGSNYRMPGAKMKHLHYLGKSGDEIRTLHLVHRFCRRNINSKVLYFHNKGSYNYHITNTNFRKALDCFVLNPRCIEQLEKGYDTCGWRISMVPHVHYSGNYWWATCRHINRLLPPLAPLRNETFLKLTASINPHRKTPDDYHFHDYPNLGLGRYFAETWIGSLPQFHAADCMSAQDNAHYLGGYSLPWGLVNEKCPSWKESFNEMLNNFNINATKDVPHIDYGLPCGESSVLIEPEKFRINAAVMKEVRSFEHYIPQLVTRSFLWYGQAPVLQLNWLAAIINGTKYTKF